MNKCVTHENTSLKSEPKLRPIPFVKSSDLTKSNSPFSMPFKICGDLISFQPIKENCMPCLLTKLRLEFVIINMSKAVKSSPL